MNNPEYAYIHIPKTGGISMENALKNIPEIKFFGHGVIFENVKNLKKIFTIREPIDRFTSSFFHLKKYKKNRESNIFENPEQLLQSILNLDVRALEFMKVYDNYHHINGVKITTDWAFAKQTSWIFDPWRILIFENLEEEISRLNNDLNVNIVIPHENKSPRTDFTYSQSSIDLIKLIYKDDFELYSTYTNK